MSIKQPQSTGPGWRRRALPIGVAAAVVAVGGVIAATGADAQDPTPRPHSHSVGKEMPRLSDETIRATSLGVAEAAGLTDLSTLEYVRTTRSEAMRTLFGAIPSAELDENVVVVHMAGSPFQYEMRMGQTHEANTIYLFLSEETGQVISSARSGRSQDGFADLGTATAMATS